VIQTRNVITTLIAAVAFMAAPPMMTKMVYAADIHHGISAYGYGNNYNSLGHPSDPNYFRVVGGIDFGIDYNCPANCFLQHEDPGHSPHP